MSPGQGCAGSPGTGGNTCSVRSRPDGANCRVAESDGSSAGSTSHLLALPRSSSSVISRSGCSGCPRPRGWSAPWDNAAAGMPASSRTPAAERFGVAQVKCRPACGSTTAKTLAVPQRCYSLSRLAVWPGAAGRGGRTCLCNETGFSSRQTTGSAGSYGFSYSARTSSMRSMYCSSSSARHNIFPPPRLEVVALKKQPHGLSSGSRHELALDRFGGNQPHRPARPARGRIPAHHGDAGAVFSPAPSRAAAPGRCLSWRARSMPPCP